MNLSALIACITLVTFLFGGPAMLELLGITIASFKIAGGIVLLIISIPFILGTSKEREEQKVTKDAAS